MDITALADDLAAEHDALEALVAPLDDEAWHTPTPAEGWDIADSISHLNFFDHSARLALTHPDAFAAHATELANNASAQLDVSLARSVAGTELRAQWREGRAQLLAAIRAADPSERVPWYGPAMSLASFTTARLMETWAHGQDIVDALGAEPVATERLRHVCHIGVGARRYAYMINRVEDPGTPVRVEAAGPNGDVWTWGPDDAADKVSGNALDLALVLTRRRHLDDTDLVVSGPTASQWMGIAQSFAGPPGKPRPPLAG